MEPSTPKVLWCLAQDKLLPSMKFYVGSLATAWLFLNQCLADIDYQLPTTSCTVSSAIGRAIYCCDGDCADGSSLGSPGLCAAFADECNDLGTPPSCSPTQIFSYATEGQIDAGMGYCYLEECRWQKNVWSWNCCNCPLGYTAVAPACGQGARKNDHLCVTCTGADEELQFDSKAQAYQCVAPTTSTTATTSTSTTSTTTSTTSSSATCAALLRALDDKANEVGRVATALGSLCPATPGNVVDKINTVVNYIGEVYSGAKALVNPGTKGENAADAALAIGSTVDGFLVAGLATLFAPEEGSLLAVVGAAYAAACTADAIFGSLVTAGSIGLEVAISVACGTPIFGRSARYARRSPVADGTLPDPQNTCVQLLDLFPFDFSAPAQLDSDCNQLYALSDDQNLTAPLQQACHSYQSSGNSTMLIALGNLLQAVQSFVPYCTNLTSTPSSSFSTSLSSSSTPATSSPSSASVPTSSHLPTLSTSKTLSHMSPSPFSRRISPIRSSSKTVSSSSSSKRSSSTSSKRPYSTSLQRLPQTKPSRTPPSTTNHPTPSHSSTTTTSKTSSSIPPNKTGLSGDDRCGPSHKGNICGANKCCSF
jgi:hypothetical protein